MTFIFEITLSSLIIHTLMTLRQTPVKRFASQNILKNLTNVCLRESHQLLTEQIGIHRDRIIQSMTRKQFSIIVLQRNDSAQRYFLS